MLGEALHDPLGVEGAPGSAPGLGLLPLSTTFAAQKLLRHTRARFGAVGGGWSALSDVAFGGYEIHHGRSEARGEAAVLRNEAGEPIGWQRGPVLGLYTHGVFESPAVLQALFGRLGGPPPRTLEQVFDGLADYLDVHFQPGSLMGLLTPSSP